MSRLIVKNLPKNITEDKLCKLFQQKGTITDVQLKYTKEGVFRQFAFIGYQTEAEAEAALKYFNNSCIQTTRIKVEVCAPLGAQEKPQSWSKYAKDSSAYKKKHDVDIEKQKKEKEEKNKSKKRNAIEEILEEHKDDPNFIEFMQVHTKDRLLWGNDANLAEQNVEKEAPTNQQLSHTKITTETFQDSKQEKSDVDEEDDKQSETTESADNDNEKLAEKQISDLEYMKKLMVKSKEADKAIEKKSDEKNKNQMELFTIKIHGIPYNTKRQDILKFFKPVKPYSVRLPTKVHGFCYVGFKTEKDFKKAMLKNKSFLKTKQVFFTDFTEKNKISKNKKQIEDENQIEETKNLKWSKQEEALKNEEDISESGKIFFRNLAYTTKEEDLQNLFEKYGPIAEINLPIDPLTRQIKGFGTVTFVMPEHAVKAFTELDGSLLHGRLLHLIPGKSEEKEENEENLEKVSFKMKKHLKLKKAAGLSHNWNTLFLGPNVVADILAKKFDTSKETILDTNAGGSSAAVRLALGETQIVMEMKKFLEENNVQLDVFNTEPKKRSKCVILAKNLPAETTVGELKTIFKKFGLLGRIVLPPSGVTAIVEFLDAFEAKKAFKHLAYSKFKNLPLYLEWAPENTFTDTQRENNKIINEEDKNIRSDGDIESEKVEEKEANDKSELKNTEITDDKDDNVEDDEPPEPETTLFLRNLNFKTRENAIRDHFKHLGPIHSIQVAMKKDPDNPKNRISLGYGFIQFKKKADTEKALKEMPFTKIEGNQVELKRSDRILKTDVKNVRRQTKVTQQTGTKILVKNIPFQAKVKEVGDIFKAFGEIRSIRLPKKSTPGEETHRGFGFVDYFTKSDAKKAFEVLCQSTHLYGRRLVLEWASVSDDNVEELRKRTAQSFVGSEIETKRSKKAVFDSSKVVNVAMDCEDDELG